ncbi:MAG: hypothetical protein ABI647_03665 [Gemmatimonadota bacterium]
MLGLELVLIAALAAPGTDDVPKATVTVDSAHREVIVTAGPFSVKSMPPGMKHDAMDAMEGHETPILRFEWPNTSWLRGFKVEVEGPDGRPINRRLIHHLIGVNFDRRQLLYPAVERLFGIGQETEEISVPASIGVPMKTGAKLGMYMAWQNELGRDLEGVTIRVRLAYSPSNLNPRPVDALPLYMDVNLTVGGTNTFDVPPGKSEKAHEFTMPISGRILGFSGHMHDYGSSVRLEDVETGKVLASAKTTRAPDGKVLKISRSLPGVTGDGIRLKAGRKYRVIGTYDNPTSEEVKGVMAHISGIFTPDDYAKWPALDLSDELLQDDLASLDETGNKAGHEHHNR